MKLVLTLAVAALALTGTAPARADNIDQGLLQLQKGQTETPAQAIMRYLRQQKYRNVGVLRFEVKKGAAPATMAAGQLNSLMATRLENALIYVADLKDPIGVTRGASTVAATRDRAANYHTAAGRQGLFQHEYPLAWGAQSVKVDAFLTGRVEISEDFSQTKLVIQCFDKKDATLREVVPPITMKTDRALLRDMGQTFVITKRSLKLKAGDGIIDDEELNDEAILDARNDNKDPGNSDPDNKNPKQPPAGSNNITQIKEYLDFQILIDGEAAEITPHGDQGKIKMPTPDQKITIKLNAKVKMGVLLRVNGVNTLGEQKDERALTEYSWWILEPNKDYTIRGFYANDMVKAFRAAAKADVDVSELGDKQERWGKIEFDVFVDKGPGVTDDVPKVEVRERKIVSLRKAVPRGKDLETVRNQVVANLSKLANREVFILGGGGEAAKLNQTTFQGNFQVGSCSITYNLPE